MNPKLLSRAGIPHVRPRQFKAASLPDSIYPFYFYVRALSGSPIPELEPTNEVAPQAPRSNGWFSRVIGPATAKCEGFAITVNGRNTIGVIVTVDRERGVPGWKAIGEFTHYTLAEATADEELRNGVDGSRGT